MESNLGTRISLGNFHRNSFIKKLMYGEKCANILDSKPDARWKLNLSITSVFRTSLLTRLQSFFRNSRILFEVICNERTNNIGLPSIPWKWSNLLDSKRSWTVEVYFEVYMNNNEIRTQAIPCSSKKNMVKNHSQYYYNLQYTNNVSNFFFITSIKLSSLIIPFVWLCCTIRLLNLASWFRSLVLRPSTFHLIYLLFMITGVGFTFLIYLIWHQDVN